MTVMGTAAVFTYAFRRLRTAARELSNSAAERWGDTLGRRKGFLAGPTRYCGMREEEDTEEARSRVLGASAGSSCCRKSCNGSKSKAVAGAARKDLNQL